MFTDLLISDLLRGELLSDQWQVLNNLWVRIDSGEQEFSLSYTWDMECHRPRWRQFSPLNEIRFASCKDQLSIRPVLADRAIVARPIRPLQLPPGQGLNLIIGSPLWIRFEQEACKLLELPVTRLSDTWFGPDTQTGELCYASETHARLSIAGVKTNPWKALTPVHLVNKGESPLHIERINIPLPNLSLYRTPDRLWTSPVRVTRMSSLDAGEIRVSAKAPVEGETVAQIAEPREMLEGGVVKKAMGLLFG